jgi:hypothetical protein
VDEGASRWGGRFKEKTTDDLIAHAKQSALVAAKERAEKLKERERIPYSLTRAMEKLLDGFLKKQELKVDKDWLNLLGMLKRKKCYPHVQKLFEVLQVQALYTGDIKRKALLLMMKMYADTGNSQKAYGLYEAIRADADGVLLVKHSLLLLAAVGKTGQMDTLMEVAGAVPKEHQQGPFFGVLLKELKLQGDHGAMETMLRKMKSGGVTPSVKHLTDTLHEAAKAKDREAMWRLYERIGELGHAPDLRVFHHMFSGCRSNSKPSELSR